MRSQAATALLRVLARVAALAGRSYVCSQAAIAPLRKLVRAAAFAGQWPPRALARRSYVRLQAATALAHAAASPPRPPSPAPRHVRFLAAASARPPALRAIAGCTALAQACHCPDARCRACLPGFARPCRFLHGEHEFTGGQAAFVRSGSSASRVHWWPGAQEEDGGLR